MDLKLLKKTIPKIASSIWSDRIIKAVLKGVAIYILLSFVFGLLYYFFDSLDFKSAAGANPARFLDYIYFSAVTFTTIGYGDIVPNSGAGQVIVMIESCFEMIYFPVFGGYIAYKFMQRPNDILLTNNFFIRYRNERIYLSSRVGNKGKNLIDCTATVEFIQLADNVKRTLYKREFNTPIIELTWYLEIRLDGDENSSALKQLKTLIANPDTSMIRTTVSGYDSNSGNMVHVFKRYTMDKLLFGGKFSDVYIWEGVKRTKPDWSNFNKVVHLKENEQKLIDSLLKS
ncbi:MAG TPA: potassium channel family protein [Bacteroidales bacterium]